MTRGKAIRQILEMLGEEEIVVAADGAIARETFRAADRARNFYMLGSMGQAASIGLGLAMTRQERVVILDGDGNLLMGMGGLAMVGGLKPANLYHLVLDNGCYATTGGQAALSRTVDLADAAAGAGYRWARRCTSGRFGRLEAEQWLEAPGPALLDLVIDEPDPDPAPRIPLSPEAIAVRFRASLLGG